MRYKQNMTMLRKAIFHLVDFCRKADLNFDFFQATKC